MSTSELMVDRQGPVLRLTLNRPARRNALSPALIDQLHRAFVDASADHALRAIVLTGAGDAAFCAGADLDPQAGTFGFNPAEPTTAYANLLRVARAVRVPMIARINGACMAGGMGLLAVCDLAVAASSARFALPEVRVGLFPMQVAALLQTLLPPRIFAEMCLTGEALSAEQALACGLLNRVATPTELDAQTDALVARVVAQSPSAIRRGKHALTASAGMTFEQAIAHMEAQAGLMLLTEDAREGMAAFAEKRAAVWTGR